MIARIFLLSVGAALLLVGCGGQAVPSTEPLAATKTSLPTIATPPKLTATAAASPEPTISPFALAEAGVTSNDKWTPYIQEFDGIRMALVPAGCFTMGSTEEEIQFTLQYCLSLFGESRCKYDYFVRENPPHKVCFEEPYWIDVIEVTNAQYGSPETVEELDHPRNNVNWFEATAHCATRGERLPTEAEWEYAARGPDGLYFPWGNRPEEAGFNFCDANCDLDWAQIAVDDGHQYTAHVGAYRDNASWVGIVDLIGNVKEWVSSLYKEYPYDAKDGREVDGDIDSTSPRVLRGGGWDNFLAASRAPFRIGINPSQISQWDGKGATGFRCARSYEGR